MEREATRVSFVEREASQSSGTLLLHVNQSAIVARDGSYGIVLPVHPRGFRDPPCVVIRVQMVQEATATSAAVVRYEVVNAPFGRAIEATRVSADPAPLLKSLDDWNAQQAGAPQGGRASAA